VHGDTCPHSDTPTDSTANYSANSQTDCTTDRRANCHAPAECANKYAEAHRISYCNSDTQTAEYRHTLSNRTANPSRKYLADADTDDKATEHKYPNNTAECYQYTKPYPCAITHGFCFRHPVSHIIPTNTDDLADTYSHADDYASK
jgi:hypothetical protein